MSTMPSIASQPSRMWGPFDARYAASARQAKPAIAFSEALSHSAPLGFSAPLGAETNVSASIPGQRKRYASDFASVTRAPDDFARKNVSNLEPKKSAIESVHINVHGDTRARSANAIAGKKIRP